jgi:hypothetical protein
VHMKEIGLQEHGLAARGRARPLELGQRRCLLRALPGPEAAARGGSALRPRTKNAKRSGCTLGNAKDAGARARTGFGFGLNGSGGGSSTASACCCGNMTPEDTSSRWRLHDRKQGRCVRLLTSARAAGGTEFARSSRSAARTAAGRLASPSRAPGLA